MAEDDEKTSTLILSNSGSNFSSPSMRSARSVHHAKVGNNNSTHLGDYLDDDDDTEESRSVTMREIEGEWIECQEIASGRRLFYNSLTMEIVFDRNPNNAKNGSNKNGKKGSKDSKDNDDDILSQDIGCETITDEEITEYLLKFGKSKWDFNNDIVDIYRLQCNNIDHKLMLPHPISMSFPEFFSTNTIPKKKSFVALVLPPKDTTQFPSTANKWNVNVLVQETTAKQLIDKVVGKLKTSLNTQEYGGDANEIIRKSSEFIIKIVGAEEYILYDDGKLIVDYEAVRKAVRNEDDVIFQLDHRPDLTMIEQECFDKNIYYISKFDTKYFDAGLLNDKVIKRHKHKQQSLLYCKYSYGDGKSLDEIILAKKHNGFTKPYQLQQHQKILLQQKQNKMIKSQSSAMSDNEDLDDQQSYDYKLDFNNNNNNNISTTDIPPPPPIDEPLPATTNTKLGLSSDTFKMKKHKSISLMEDEEPLNDDDDDDETDKEESIPPPPPPMPDKNGNANTTKAAHNNQGLLLNGTNGHIKTGSNGSHPAVSLTTTIVVDNVQAHSPSDKFKRSKTPNNMTASISNNGSGGSFLHRQRSQSNPEEYKSNTNKNNTSSQPKLTTHISYNNGKGRSRENSKLNNNSKNMEIMNQFASKMKILSGKEILANIPSMKDTKNLYSMIPPKAEQIKKGDGIKELLLHEFQQFYRVKMSFMTNVTHLPRYKHYFQTQKVKEKKLCIIVRHELWIGDLKYATTTFDTDYKTKISDGMRFLNSKFYQSRKKFCDLARESCISFTVFLCKLKTNISKDQDNINSSYDNDNHHSLNNGHNDDINNNNNGNNSSNNKKKGKKPESIYEEMIPIAFARFPLIDVRNLLRDGKYALNLWPVPIYIAEYKGAKCDPYINLAFRYRGTTTDRHFKRFKKVSKIDKLTGNELESHQQLQNIFKLGIEFEQRKLKIVAPPLNYRTKHKDDGKSMDDENEGAAQNLTQAQILRAKAKELSRANTLKFQNTANLSLADMSKAPELETQRKASFFGLGKNKDKQRKKQEEKARKTEEKRKKEEELRKKEEWKRVHKIVSKDVLYQYTMKDKELLWKYRDDLCKMPNSLNCFLRCVDWRDSNKRSEAYDYMEKWTPSPYLEDSLELLSYEFMDTYVREYSVMRIAQMHDSDLQRYLLQLVQCLKYELHHNNALIRLLIRRALSNPNQIGHFLFWHLKSEYLDKLELNLQYLERFGLYLEEYLLFSQNGHARDIMIQCNVCKVLALINSKLRLEKKLNKTPKDKLKEMLHIELEKVNKILPNTFVLPINPRWRCTQFVVDECKTMDSAQMPLWLSCKNVDDSTGDQNTIIMFKTGDDLRQDILTLQVLTVMDKIWLDRGLNLRLLPYNVVSTGDGQGMVEIVLNSRTTTWIHTHYGGGPQKGARDITTHLKYIKDVCDDNITYVNKARDIYTRSCAGYCIASYVMGLGDRHPSNIMVRTKGELFHIDFSHFLGNFKSQNIIGEYVKWQREVAPFVFLPAYKYAIDNGGKDESKYNEFLQFAVNAYLALRQRHRLLINLFILMLPSQMPELIQKQHINYLRDQLHLPASDHHTIRQKDKNGIENNDVYPHILKVIKDCLNDKRRIIDNTFHAIKHQ